MQLIPKIATIQSVIIQVVRPAVHCGRHGHRVPQHVVPQRKRDCEYVPIAIRIAILPILSIVMFPNVKKIVITCVPAGLVGHHVRLRVVRGLFQEFEHVQLIVTAS